MREEFKRISDNVIPAEMLRERKESLRAGLQGVLYLAGGSIASDEVATAYERVCEGLEGLMPDLLPTSRNEILRVLGEMPETVVTFGPEKGIDIGKGIFRIAQRPFESAE